MKFSQRYNLLLVLSAAMTGSFFLPPSNASADNQNAQQKGDTENMSSSHSEHQPKADKIITKGAWALEISFRHPGTRSEGQDGVLKKDGIVVEPQHLDQVLQTDLGKIKYYGPYSDKKHSWELSGWNFADESVIKRTVTYKK